MRPEGLNDQKMSAFQACWPPSLPAFRLFFIFRDFEVIKIVLLSRTLLNYPPMARMVL